MVCLLKYKEETSDCVPGWILSAPCAQKGAKCLPDVADILQDIYYYFQKSDKRLGDFSRMQEMFDIEQKKMHKHVCTRWLSIGRCLERLLHNWVPLKEFFKSEKETQDKVKEK